MLYEGKKALPQVSDRVKAEREAAKLSELEEKRLKRMNDEDDPSDDDEQTKSRKKKVKIDETVTIQYNKEGKSRIIGLNDSRIVETNPDEEVGTFYEDDELDVEDMEEDGEFEDEADCSDIENDVDEEAAEDLDDDEEEDEDIDIDGDQDEIDISASSEKKEIPFTFDCPLNYKSFVKLYSSYGDDQLITVTERLIKCNHPSLKKGNKNLLGDVFKFGLRLYDQLSIQKVFNRTRVMIPVLRKYLEVDPCNGAKIVRSLLEHKVKTYIRKNVESDIRPTAKFDLIAFFNLVSELFPTSDAFHPVCTPTLYFLIDVLRYSYINSLQSVGVSLCLMKILTRWVSDSKRWVY